VFSGKGINARASFQNDPFVAFLKPLVSMPPESASEISNQTAIEAKERDPVVEFFAPLLAPSATPEENGLKKLLRLAEEVKAAAPGAARESRRLELWKAIRGEPLYELFIPVSMLDDEKVREAFKMSCDYFRCLAAFCQLLRLRNSNWTQFSEAHKRDIWRPSRCYERDQRVSRGCLQLFDVAGARNLTVPEYSLGSALQRAKGYS
jgi:hypothetical protein